MKLREKVAVVTGAGSGQGRAVALLFAQEGARVVVGDVNAQGADETVSFIVAAGGKAVATAGDLSKASAAQALVAAALDAYGRLDILYNNAGVFWADRDAPTAELEEHVWDRILDINLKSVYLCCKYALPELIRSRGCIINVSSVAGYAGDKDFHAYPASKGAMLSFTRSLAQKYGPQGVRANVLCPGFIETPMVQFVLDDRAVVDGILQSTALRRLGKPEEIARVALFLASDDASFVTGSIIVADGGLVK